MRLKVKVQVGAFDRKGKFDEDLVNLIRNEKNAYYLSNMWQHVDPMEFTQTKVHRMADGTPHLIEYELVQNNL